MKVIKKGADSESVRVRFEAERQTLALTDHPNIARLFDAGTTESGRPYFVMELVPGLPITQFCDRQKLTVRQRVELYLIACRAIHHAHQKGIIHRDLKPSNILVAEVDGAASPKVIDFGVSRMITADGSMAEDPQLLGTPQYMSPEQSLTHPGGVDIRSDVYALGAMLYELLAGVTAFDWTGRQVQTVQDLRAIFDAEPVLPPSRRLEALTDRAELQRIADARRTGIKPLKQSLRQDLDWIILKAIARERTARYDSVAALADDLQRHLDHRPVQASPEGALYYFGRFYRRNRTAVLLLTAVAVSLVVGLLVVSSLLVKTRVAGEQARQARDQAVAQEQAKVVLLRESYLQQARARMLTRTQGRRLETLKTMRLAAQIRPSMELRNLAIACMSIPDIEPVSTLRVPGVRGSAVFARDGCRYAYAGEDGAVHIVRSTDGAQILQISLPDKLATVVRSFSVDGRYIEFECKVHIPKESDRVGFQTWDIQTNRPVTQHLDWPPCEFSPHCDRLVMADNRSRAVLVYELPSGRLLKSISGPRKIRSVSFSPIDDRLAIASNEDFSVTILQADTGTKITSIPTGDDWIYGVAWSPNGRSITVTGENRMDQVREFNVQTGKLQVTLNGSLAPTLGITYSDDGRFLLTGGWDGHIRLWSMRRGEEVLSIPSGGGVGFLDSGDFQVADGASTETWKLITGRECQTYSGSFEEGAGGTAVVSPEGKFLAEQTITGIVLWNLNSQKQYAFVAAGGLRSIAFSPDGSTLYASAPDLIRHWNVADIAGCAESPAQSINSEATVAMALSQEGHTMISGTDDGDLFVSDPTTNEIHRLAGPRVPFRRYMAVSPDGKWAATSPRYAEHFEIWNLIDQKLVTTVQRCPLSGDIGPVAFSADGKTLFLSDGSALRWLQVGTWQTIRSLAVNPERQIDNTSGQLAVSPDGKFIAFTVQTEGAILADQRTGEILATFDTPATPQGVGIIGFSPDSTKLLITGGGTVAVWDIPLVRKELADMNLDWK